MTHAEDKDLRERFAAQRREDAATTAPFAAVLAAAKNRPVARRPFGRLVPVTAAAVLAMMVLVVGVLRTPSRPQPLVSLADTRWQGPTDFLLQVPGAEYLSSVPTLSLPTNAYRRNP